METQTEESPVDQRQPAEGRCLAARWLAEECARPLERGGGALREGAWPSPRKNTLWSSVITSANQLLPVSEAVQTSHNEHRATLEEE
ncbi:hypothetical protein EYF80_061768 [Liparis tanakae]|uniref:Uncharacterized protein n=1 Tax=Liparis tanakae TaxID=230148 RepID=A0A4Z2EH74_9TELE|nr:hypothetical protein EYF80_061768 [Liparis tanakae]